MTNEHALPSWLEPILPGEGNLLHEIGHPKKRGKNLHEWNAGVFDAKVKRVCRACNNGWMNDLENRARPVLVTLVRGHGRTLYREDQRVLATWAAKTAMMMQFVVGDFDPIPVGHYKQLYGVQDRPPETTQIWIGAVKQGTFSWCRAVNLGLGIPGVIENVRGYGVAFNIGHLVFQIFGHELGKDRAIRNLGDGRPFGQALTEIWPSRGIVEFPPPYVFTPDQFDQVLNGEPENHWNFVGFPDPSTSTEKGQA